MTRLSRFLDGMERADVQFSSRTHLMTRYQQYYNDLPNSGTGGATLFSPELSADMWGGSGAGSQAGLRLNINAACCGTGS